MSLYGYDNSAPPVDNPREFNRRQRFVSVVKYNPFVFGDDDKDPDDKVLDYQPEPSDRLEAQVEQMTS